MVNRITSTAFYVTKMSWVWEMARKMSDKLSSISQSMGVMGIFEVFQHMFAPGSLNRWGLMGIFEVKANDGTQ